MKEVVIAGYLRTPQTRSMIKEPERDWFYKISADELLSKLTGGLINKTGINPKENADFLVGCAFGVNEQWTYGGRTPIFLSNLPETVPAKFVDQQCGSGMACIHIAFMEIATGFADIVLVGGMEHMARVPNGGTTLERGHVAPNQRLFKEEIYKHWDMMTVISMGLTAEKLLRRPIFQEQTWIDLQSGRTN